MLCFFIFSCNKEEANYPNGLFSIDIEDAEYIASGPYVGNSNLYKVKVVDDSCVFTHVDFFDNDGNVIDSAFINFRLTDEWDAVTQVNSDYFCLNGAFLIKQEGEGENIYYESLIVRKSDGHVFGTHFYTILTSSYYKGESYLQKDSEGNMYYNAGYNNGFMKISSIGKNQFNENTYVQENQLNESLSFFLTNNGDLFLGEGSVKVKTKNNGIILADQAYYDLLTHNNEIYGFNYNGSFFKLNISNGSLTSSMINNKGFYRISEYHYKVGNLQIFINQYSFNEIDTYGIEYHYLGCFYDFDNNCFKNICLKKDLYEIYELTQSSNSSSVWYKNSLRINLKLYRVNLNKLTATGKQTSSYEEIYEPEITTISFPSELEVNSTSVVNDNIILFTAYSLSKEKYVSGTIDSEGTIKYFTGKNAAQKYTIELKL